VLTQEDPAQGNPTSADKCSFQEYFLGSQSKSDADLSSSSRGNSLGESTFDFLAERYVFKAAEALGTFGLVALGVSLGAPTVVTYLGYKAVSYAFAKNIAPVGTKMAYKACSTMFSSGVEWGKSFIASKPKPQPQSSDKADPVAA